MRSTRSLRGHFWLEAAVSRWALSLLCVSRGMVGPLFKRILVPVDFSSCSEEALRVALELAEALTAEVTVMHVIDVNTVDAFNRLGLLAVPSGAMAQRKRLRHHARLKRIVFPYHVLLSPFPWSEEELMQGEKEGFFGIIVLVQAGRRFQTFFCHQRGQ